MALVIVILVALIIFALAGGFTVINEQRITPLSSSIREKKS